MDAEAEDVRSDWLDRAVAEAEAEDRASGVWEMKAAASNRNGAPTTASEADFHELLGAFVRVHGLQGKPELNGSIGRCMSWDVDVGRAGVKLLLPAAGAQDKRDKMVAIKPANLTVLDDEEEVAAVRARLDAPPALDKETEFEGNAAFDRLALYLRPLDVMGGPLQVSNASASQERWGGLHATLCSFAPAHDSGAPVAHRRPVLAALERAHAAVRAALPPGASRWSLARETQGAALLHDGGKKLMLMPPSTAEAGGSRALHALSDALGESGLCNARPAERLHLSCGDAEGAAAVRDVLLSCEPERWELCVVKCAAGVAPLRVTEVCERRELVFG